MVSNQKIRKNHRMKFTITNHRKLHLPITTKIFYAKITSDIKSLNLKHREIVNLAKHTAVKNKSRN